MNVYFEPWIGKEYYNQDVKILVIGDSHYCGGCDKCGIRGCTIPEMGECKNFTRNTIKNYLSFRAGIIEKSNWMTKTYLPFDKIYFGHEDVTLEESLKLWNKIAFHQFVQTAISEEASNTNYTNDDYSLSSPMAKEVINILKPDFIIVWGNRAYNSLDNENWTQGSDNFNGSYLLPSGKSAKCIRIYHPSRANVETWHSILNNFINTGL